MKKNVYTDEMVEFLCGNLEKYSWVELTNRFNQNFNCNKGVDSIRHFCSRNEKCSRKEVRKNLLVTEFSEEMEDFLRVNFKDISHEELTRRFNSKFNLKKEIYDIRYYCSKYELRKNGTGMISGIGLESVWPAKKWVYVKVDRGKWKAKHRLLWEQVNGPIPKGYCIIFADGNIENFRFFDVDCGIAIFCLLRQRYHIRRQSCTRKTFSPLVLVCNYRRSSKHSGLIVCRVLIALNMASTEPKSPGHGQEAALPRCLSRL